MRVIKLTIQMNKGLIVYIIILFFIDFLEKK